MDGDLDDNNNSSGYKSYSLRPQSARRGFEELDKDDRRPSGRRRRKQKSAPLSNYRRKTTNARERSRMREINEAFEALRRAVPHLNAGGDSAGEKVSKIMTLRLAMKYIAALTGALEGAERRDLQIANFQVADFRGAMYFRITDSCSTASSFASPAAAPTSDPLTVDTRELFARYSVKTDAWPPPTVLTPPDETGRPRPPDAAPEFLFSAFDGLPSPTMDFCDLFAT